MSDTRYLDLPFFEDSHRALARALDAWAAQTLPGPDMSCRDISAALRVTLRAIRVKRGLSAALAHAFLFRR